MNKEKRRIRQKCLKADLQPRRAYYDAEIKLRILHLVENGTDMDAAAESFGVSSRSIRNWQDDYDRAGRAGLEPRPKSGRDTFVPDEDVRKCIEEVQEEGILTTARLQARIKEMHGVRYAESSIRYIMAKHGMTYKKANPVHARGATNGEIDEWRRENIPYIDEKREGGHEVFSVDEAHSKLDSDARHGYAPCGVRLYATYHGRKQNVGIIGAVGERGRSMFRAKKVFNQWSFMAFLNEFARMLGRRKAVLLLDGATYHDSLRVREWFEGHPRIVPVYLPAGSPHMNSIENVWGALGRHMSQFVYHDAGEYRRKVLEFLRRYDFSRNIFGKLFATRPPEAEKCIENARAQLAAMAAN